MKTAFLILLILAFHSVGCAKEPRPAPTATAQPTGSVRTAEQAIEVVQRHIQKSGGDPSREEITAEWRNGQWQVTSWHIFYPNKTGASRFVPGGHIFYTVSPDGHITQLMPGA